MTVSFPPFQFGYLLFLFLVWLLGLLFPVLCCIGGVKSGHPCLALDLNGKAFSFCTLSMMLAVGLSYMVFIMLRNAFSIPTLLSAFIINGYCTLSNAFSASIYIIMWFLSLLFYVVYYVYWFANIVLSLHPWDESHLIMVYDLFNVLLDVVQQYFVEDFSIYVHQRYWPVVFFLCCVGFGITIILAS